MRADTLWKKAPSQVMSSVAFSSRVPTASRAAVVVMTTLEWKVSFRKLPALRMSSITRKPRPPKMIMAQVTRFSSTSL